MLLDSLFRNIHSRPNSVAWIHTSEYVNMKVLLLQPINLIPYL